jgi:hypothetical protein
MCEVWLHRTLCARQSKHKKVTILHSRKAVGVLVGMLLWGTIFFAYVTIQGIPLSWITHQLPILSGVQQQFSIKVSPQVPTTSGQEITVTVTDRDSLQPVEGATVSVSLNGAHLIDLPTDAAGMASFEYPGETTIVVVKGGLYTPAMVVIPRVPDRWVMELFNGLVLATISGIASGVAVAYLRVTSRN